MDEANESVRCAIDQALQAWRQGDCVLGEQWFSFRIDIDFPLTSAAAIAAESDADVAETRAPGLMVATQTCDIVRTCTSRPFIEVCPLMEVDEPTFAEVRRGQRPRFAHLPGVEARSLVADLDRVMTMEKAVLFRLERVPGCHTDEDSRRLAFALARKRSRFAFPNDFVAGASQLRRRLSSKHDKDSHEGRALRALREIRIRAEPSWDAEAVALTFWFIRNEGALSFEGERWDQHLDAWLRLLPEWGRFRPIQGLVLALDDLTAKDYIESDLLDLDHLSMGGDDMKALREP